MEPEPSPPHAASAPASSESVSSQRPGMRGHRDSDVLEKLRGRGFYLHPDKPFRVIWEIISTLLVLWVTMSLPFKMAFMNAHVNDDDPFFAFQIFVDTFFMLDLAVNFYTAFYDRNEQLVTDHRLIKLHYLRSWFLVDLFGSIPFDYLIYAVQRRYYTSAQLSHFLRTLRVVKLFRMLKISNLYRYFGRWEELFSTTAVKIFKLLVILLYFLHVDSCLFFLIARWHVIETGEWAPDSWVSVVGVQDADIFVQYFYSLWHVSSHMLSISYGPYNPVRLEECVSTFLSMLVGAGLYATIIGTTTSIMQQRDMPGAEWSRQWDELKVFMRHKNVPPELRDRLRSYFNARWQGRKIFREDIILSSLPEPYVRSLRRHDCEAVLKSVPLLQTAPEAFLTVLVPLLEHRLVLEGERVLEQREPPSRWWILSRGRVGLYRDGLKFAELGAGEYCGQFALLFGVPTPFSVVTEAHCEFATLNRPTFEATLSEFPEVLSRLQRESYKTARRGGLAPLLRAEAARGLHASAFTRRTAWDWDVAEAELQAEAAVSGESIEPPDDLFTRQWRREAEATQLDRLRKELGKGWAQFQTSLAQTSASLHLMPPGLRSSASGSGISNSSGGGGSGLGSAFHRDNASGVGRGRLDCTGSGCSAAGVNTGGSPGEIDGSGVAVGAKTDGISGSSGGNGQLLGGLRQDMGRFGVSVRQSMTRVRDAITSSSGHPRNIVRRARGYSRDVLNENDTGVIDQTADVDLEAPGNDIRVADHHGSALDSNNSPSSRHGGHLSSPSDVRVELEMQRVANNSSRRSRNSGNNGSSGSGAHSGGAAGGNSSRFTRLKPPTGTSSPSLAEHVTITHYLPPASSSHVQPLPSASMPATPVPLTTVASTDHLGDAAASARAPDPDADSAGRHRLISSAGERTPAV